MHKLGVLQIGFHACRHFTATSMNCKNSSKHEARVWEKLLKRSTKNPIDLNMPVKGPSPHVSRRAVVLNKTYMNYVLQTMSNCDIYEEIVGENIQISHVKITNDFKILNIYWFAESENTEDCKMLEERLQRYAGPLRHKLAQLRVIGRVPHVQFVRDKQINLIQEIEQRLAQADFGKDYERSPYFKSQYSVTYSTENEHKGKKLKSDDIVEPFSVTLPEMRHDVFGLDHTKIMQKIQVMVNKKVDAREKRKNAASNDVASDSEQENSFTFLSQNEQEKKFNKFLRDRKIQQYRKRKVDRSHEDIDDFTTHFDESSTDEPRFEER